MARQTFTHTAVADASIGEVWARLDVPSTWESIGGVDRVFDPIVDEAGRLKGFSFETVAAGRTYVGEATADRREERRVMSWNVRNSEIEGNTKVELTESGSATSMVVTLEVESVSMLSGMFFGIIAAAIGQALPDAVEEFASGMSRNNGGADTPT